MKRAQQNGEMKTLLVTSQTTFAPMNYDGLVAELAACPQIGGLLILANRNASLLLKAFWLIGCGAWRLGTALLVNAGPASRRRRRAAFAACGKPVWELASINSPAATETVAANGFDLVLNARTRKIYKEPMLTAPRLGCINIHHGLLPEQRGTMCDLWALSEGRPAGFSIHVMTAGIDEGGILARVAVSDGQDRHYPRYLRRACGVEAREVARVLREIETTGRPTVQPNPAPENLTMRRNPDRRQLRRMIRSGMRL